MYIIMSQPSSCQHDFAGGDPKSGTNSPCVVSHTICHEPWGATDQPHLQLCLAFMIFAVFVFVFVLFLLLLFVLLSPLLMTMVHDLGLCVQSFCLPDVFVYYSL